MFVYIAKKAFPENHLATGDIVALCVSRIEEKYQSEDFQEVLVPDDKVAKLGDDDLRYWKFVEGKFQRKTDQEVETIESAQLAAGNMKRAEKVAEILKTAAAEDPRIGEALAQAIIAAGYELRKVE